MVADTLKLRAFLDVRSPITVEDISRLCAVEVIVEMAVTNKLMTTIVLGSDGATAIDFSGLSVANVIFLRSSEKIIARLTSASGTTQAIPVDTFLCLASSTAGTGITALTLERLAGVATDVQLVLAEV